MARFDLLLVDYTGRSFRDGKAATSREVAEIEVAVTADGNPAAEGQHLKRRQQLAVRVEFLHAAVVEVGDEDLVGGIDGNADREVELARL